MQHFSQKPRSRRFNGTATPTRCLQVSEWSVSVLLIWLSLGIATFSPLGQSKRAIAAGLSDSPLGDPLFAPAIPEDTPIDTDAQQTAPIYNYFLYLPFSVVTSNGLVVDPQDKDASSNFYHRYYADPGEANNGRNTSLQSVTSAMHLDSVDPDWTGNHADCEPGDVSQAFRDAILLRINYFRAMAGVPANVEFSDEYNRMAQQAALMMSANNALDHSPDPSWDCYAPEGARAAGSSNLFLGMYAWDAISGYIQDPGAGNVIAGHRRWILYPQTQFMGTGDVPLTTGYPSANALWVFDEHIWDPRPATRDEFVAWPPPGYIPYQVTFPLWSFAYTQADFSNTSVRMTSNGNAISLTLYEASNGYGENTVTWEPAIEFGQPGSETRYQVQIDNVTIDGTVRDFVYDVIVFDPDA